MENLAGNMMRLHSMFYTPSGLWGMQRPYQLTADGSTLVMRSK